MAVALVSILCRDQVGLVAAVADHLFSHGVNLRDTTFASLGQGAEFTSIVELPDGLDPASLWDGLALLPELEGAEIRVTAYAFDPQPGPIARLADIFAQNGANIVRLDAQKLPEAEGGRYVTRFLVWLPAARADL